jgi:hypothetical protein
MPKRAELVRTVGKKVREGNVWFSARSGREASPLKESDKCHERTFGPQTGGGGNSREKDSKP